VSNQPQTETRNWVFLGDSLTEGIGSQRHSHVTELVSQLRDARSNGHGPTEVHLMRMRRVDPGGFDRFINFNMAGFLDPDTKPSSSALWIWNLACEGQTIDTDDFWLPFLRNLRPELIVLFRGSLESIIRPAMLIDNSWPWWVPNSWRGYAVMDPRCYFSSTWWRRAKQETIDRVKQTTRRKLLSERPGLPLMDPSVLIAHYENLLTQLRPLSSQILILGLLPPDSRRFPGSPENFAQVNRQLSALASRFEVEFLDWGQHLLSNRQHDEIFYLDGFHPNPNGNRILASILAEYLSRDTN
jgi:GDSL-like Lipase/Acylhydrolase family